MARVKAIAVSDAETDPFKIGRVPRPFIWGCFDGLRYQEFYAPLNTPIIRCEDGKCGNCVGCISTEQFVAYVRQQAVIMYAHNGGKFDWHFLLPYLQPYDEIMIINGRIAKCFIGNCELRDSYNILPVPLKEYKKDEIDYAIMEADVRYLPQNWQTIRDYLRSDCVYLHELISAFVTKYGVQITQASAAMSQWKKISKREIPSSGREFYDALAPYYYGGRVQCFESGVIDARFSVIDINSAYPKAMMNRHPYSTSFTEVSEYVPDADFYKIEARATGCFPYRGEGNPERFAGLRFPADGEARMFTITGWEYRAAVETETLARGSRVIESIFFDDYIDFGEYIQYFYEMRLRAKAEKNEAESLFAKLLMNSLYGKFAANPENYRDYIIVPMDVIPGLESEGYEFAGELGPWALACKRLEESRERYYNIATGASITGFVRAMLMRAMAASKGVLYCDTDSIAVRERGTSIVLGDKLGEWKHEGDFDRAGIAGKKLYIFRGVPHKRVDSCLKNPDHVSEGNGMCRHMKTASKGARLNHAQLWQVASGKAFTWESEAPTFSPIKKPSFVKRVIKYTAERKHGEVEIVRHDQVE